MANEITVSIRFDVANGNYDPGTINASNLQFDQAAVGAAEGVQEIGTSEESLSTGDLSTYGWLYLRNLDDTNYVQVGFSTGVYGIRLEPGEPAVFRTEPTATVYLLANTAACNVQYRWLED
jgi:hypothetical protein